MNDVLGMSEVYNIRTQELEVNLHYITQQKLYLKPKTKVNF